MGILEFVKNNIIDIIDVLTLIVISLVGGFTIYHNYRTRQSQKRNEESQKRVEESQKRVEKLIASPKVVVSLRRDEVNTSWLLICVKNVGTGTAKNVQFQPSNPSLETVSGIPLGDIGFIKTGIDYFVSGEEYKIPINAIGIWDELIQTPLKIKITYEDSAGEEHVENVNLDFGIFESVPLVKSPIGAISGTAKEMVNATEKMVRATKDIGRELNQYTRLRVGDKVRTRDELPAMIDGNNRQRTTIPKGAICTVLEVTQKDITIEWDEAPDEEGRVVYRGWRVLSNRFYDIVEIKLPPKQ